MLVLIRTYMTASNNIQCNTVKNAHDANKFVISIDRTLEDKVFLERRDNKQVYAIKINGEWHISETEIIE